MAQNKIHHTEKYLLTSAGGRATRFGGFPKHLLKIKRDKTRILLADVLRVRERTPLQVILAIKEADATQSWIKEAEIDIVLKEPPFGPSRPSGAFLFKGLRKERGHVYLLYDYCCGILFSRIINRQTLCKI